MSKRSILNRAICAIITLLLIFELLIVFSITILKQTIGSKEYLLAELDKTNYYAMTKSEIESSFRNYVLQSNLDDDTVKDIVSVEKIKEDTLVIIDNAYDGHKQEIDVKSIKEELSNRIHDKVKNEYNITITASEEKDIQTLVEVIIQNYNDHIDIVNAVISTLASISSKLDMIKNTYLIAGYAAIGITCVILSVIYIIGCKNKKAFINKYQGIAFMTSGTMLVITNIAFGFFIKESEIGLFTKGITALIIDIVQNIRFEVMLFGIILFVIGVFLSIIKNVLIKEYLR